MAQAAGAGVASAAAGQVNEVNGGVPNEANRGVRPVVVNAQVADLGAPAAIVAVPAAAQAAVVAAPAAVVAAGPVMANLAAAPVPVPGPGEPTFDIGDVLLGPLPTKGNISCEIHAWIDEEGP